MPDASNVDPCRRDLIKGGVKLVCPGSFGAELPDIFKSSLDPIRLDFSLLLSNNSQQVGENEWVVYKSRWGGVLQHGFTGFVK